LLVTLRPCCCLFLRWVAATAVWLGGLLLLLAYMQLCTPLLLLLLLGAIACLLMVCILLLALGCWKPSGRCLYRPQLPLLMLLSIYMLLVAPWPCFV
jgi:hypothetical protein